MLRNTIVKQVVKPTCSVMRCSNLYPPQLRLMQPMEVHHPTAKNWKSSATCFHRQTEIAGWIHRSFPSLPTTLFLSLLRTVVKCNRSTEMRSEERRVGKEASSRVQRAVR